MDLASLTSLESMKSV